MRREDTMVDFFQTKMGRMFFDSTMPRIAKALEELASKLSPETLGGMYKTFKTLALIDKRIYSAMSPGQVAKEILNARIDESERLLEPDPDVATAADIANEAIRRFLVYRDEGDPSLAEIEAQEKVVEELKPLRVRSAAVDPTHPILLDYNQPENAKLLDVIMVGRKIRWDVTVLKNKTKTLEDAREVVANYLRRVEKLGVDVEIVEIAYEEDVGGWRFRLENFSGYESESGD
jgi:hypothetical protein